MKKEKSNCIGRRIVMSGAVALREPEPPLFHNEKDIPNKTIFLI